MDLLRALGRALAEVFGQVPVESTAVLLRGEFLVTQRVRGNLVTERRVDGLEGRPSFPAAAEVERAEGQEAAYLVSLPVRASEQDAGVLRFQFPGDPPATDTALRARLDELASWASWVLPTCIGHESHRADRYILLDILQAASMVQAIREPETTATEAMRIAQNLLAVDRCLIGRLEPGSQKLRILAQRSFPREDWSGSFDLEGAGDCLLLRALRRGEPIWQAERSTPIFPEGSVSTGQGQTYNAMALPLVSHGRPFGVFYADYLENRGQINEERFLAIRLFANTLAAQLETAALMEELAAMADEDPMTGVANRRTLSRTLHREVARARRAHSAISMLVIDIDNFKACNDLYGHPAGDQVIISTAEVLRSATRASDLVARYGGDEFVVLMPDTDADEARVVEERVRQASLGAARLLDKPRWRYQLSIGRECARGSRAADLLESADAALYRQKGRRARHHLYRALVGESSHQSPAGASSLLWLLGLLGESNPSYPDRSRRMLDLGLAIAERLGWSEEDREVLALATLLHGLEGIAPIPGTPFLGEESASTAPQGDTRPGLALLAQLSGMAPVAEVIRLHHSRWGGTHDSDLFTLTGSIPQLDAVRKEAQLLRLLSQLCWLERGQGEDASSLLERQVQLLDREAGQGIDPQLAATAGTILRERARSAPQ